MYQKVKEEKNTDIKELSWVRTYLHKFDKSLRSEILAQYRSVNKKPCIFQKLYGKYKAKKRSIPVIIELAQTRGEEEKLKFAQQLLKDKKNIKKLNIINSYSTNLSINDLKDISQRSLVKKIYLDREVEALLDVAVPTTACDKVWHHNFTGKNITIAILDTGIHTHPDFLKPTNRIIAFKDFTEAKKSQPYDDNGHGTHCAGAAAGNGHASLGKYKAPAFGAKIVAIKILDKMGSGKSSQVIQGLQWCLQNSKKYNIRIASLSVGYKAVESYQEDPVCLAIEKLWNKGIVICAAAGNDGPEDKTINSPGIHPSVITVGASDDKRTPNLTDDIVADFSSRGPTIDGYTKPDVLIPGTDIISARVTGSFLDFMSINSIVDKNYISLSGTSMATPICAGIIAQLLEAYPKLSPAEVKQCLIESCIKLDNTDNYSQGYGCIDASKLISRASQLHRK